MTDRDLIAEGRELLLRVAPSPSRTPDPWTAYEWVRLNLGALLDALEAVQRPQLDSGATIVAPDEPVAASLWHQLRAAHERELDLVMRAEKAEAAQRPPLGYMVTFDDLYGRELAYDYRELIENKSDALDALETARFNQPSRAQAYQLAEVREVQP
jgi:hypothetical protein